MELRGTGYFGKVPLAGDFQRSLPPDGPDGRTLDWFHDGWMRHALAGRRPDPTTSVGFVWQRPGSVLAWIGVLVASRDRTGRRFPLLVFGAVGGCPGAAQLLSASHDFLARAESAAESGRTGMDVAALRGHVGSLHTGLDPDGPDRQAAWEAATPAEQWAEGVPGGLASRMRALDFAFSGGARPNFVLRGRWQGDLRHLAAGLKLLQRMAGQSPAMLFWDRADGAVAWRVAFDYAHPGMFEALLWHDAPSSAAFDTEPGAVPIPPTFVGGQVPPLDRPQSLAWFLDSRGS